MTPTPKKNFTFEREKSLLIQAVREAYCKTLLLENALNEFKVSAIQAGKYECVDQLEGLELSGEIMRISDQLADLIERIDQELLAPASKEVKKKNAEKNRQTPDTDTKDISEHKNQSVLIQ